MIVMNEHFLANAGSKYRINVELPLRLQKRVLLTELGFPGNPKLKACRSCDTKTVGRLFEDYSVQGYPFLVIVSEKPMSSLVPPLFVVNDSRTIRWRDNRGNKRLITVDETMSIIQAYHPNTWLEFSPYIWGSRTIGGRLIYTVPENQVLEIQQGAIPSNLIDDRQLPTYVGELSFLDLERYCYLEESRRLGSIGYLTICPFVVIRFVCKKMQPLFASFEELRRISRLPTLEFAVTKTGQFITIDIDWPAQWIDKGGD